MLRMHTLQCSSFLRPLNRLPLSLSQNLLLQYNVTSLSFRCRTERDRRRVCRCIAQAGTDTNFSTSGNALRDSNARLGSDRDGTMGPQTSVSSGVRSNVNSSTMRPPVAQPVMPAVIKSYRVSLWGERHLPVRAFVYQGTRVIVPCICRCNEV